MDGSRFDQLTRLVGRRQMIKTIAAAFLAGITRRATVDDAGATFVCVLTCPGSAAVSNDPNQCGAVVTYPPPAFDPIQCGVITCSPASGSFFPVGSTPVVCTSTLGAGTCSFNVTVSDNQPPTITCPANITEEGVAPLIVNYPAPTASDNCPGVTVLCSPASGSAFPAGSTTVTCTATDAVQNTASCSFDVEVIEPTATPTETETEIPTETPTETETETETPVDTETVPPGSTDTPTVPATDVPATEVPGSETPTEDPGTQAAATEVPTATAAPVSQLPNTGSNDGSGKNWLIPAGLLGAGAALAARLGLRNVVAPKPVEVSDE